MYALYSFSARALPCFSNQSKLGRGFLCLSMFVHFFSQNLVWPPFTKAYEDLKHSIEKLGASLEKVWNDLNEMKVKYGKFEQAMEASTTVPAEASAPSEQSLPERSMYRAHGKKRKHGSEDT